MTQQAEITPAGANIASVDTDEGPSLYERREALKARLNASTEEAVEETGDEPQQPETDQVDEPPVTKPDRKAKRGEDLDRLDALERDVVKRGKVAKEREESAQAVYAQLERQKHEFAQERAAFAEFQKRMATPDGLLEHFESLGGDQFKIAEYVMSANDPAKRAQLEARRAVDPVQKRLDDMQAKIDAYEARQAQAQAMNEFRAHLGKASGAEHASAMQENDPAYLQACAIDAARELETRRTAYGQPAPFDFDDVIEKVEERLQREAKRHAGKSNGASASAAQAKPASKTNAKAPANQTISQQEQSARTAATQGRELHELSLDERRELAKSRRRTG